MDPANLRWNEGALEHRPLQSRQYLPLMLPDTPSFTGDREESMLRGSDLAAPKIASRQHPYAVLERERRRRRKRSASPDEPQLALSSLRGCGHQREDVACRDT